MIEARLSSMSSLNHVSVTATMSTGLIESDAVNSSNFGKSDRAFKEIFGSIVLFVRTPIARLGSAALVIFTWIRLFKLRWRRKFLGVGWRLDNMMGMSCIVGLGCGSGRRREEGKFVHWRAGSLGRSFLFPRRCRTRSRWFDQSFSRKSLGGGGGGGAVVLF
jgi:hypothetical protein